MGMFSVNAGGPLEQLLRTFGLVAVIGLVALAFWKNSERNEERLNARSSFSDAAGALSEDEREHVRAFIGSLRKTYGIEAKVQIAAGELAPPPADGKTLFVGVSPQQKTAVVLLPPLARRALGPDFARQLESEHFPFYFEPGRSWQKGLVLALDLIESRLAALAANDGANDNTNAGANAGAKNNDNATSPIRPDKDKPGGGKDIQ